VANSPREHKKPVTFETRSIWLNIAILSALVNVF
jgi:hypothetical protein